MKNKKHYIITGFISIVILSIIFMIKGFFPFGEHSIFWGDLHAQVTALYYEFYDAIYSTKSLIVSFASGGGVNLVGINNYYIISPFTPLVLLFQRSMIPSAVNIIISLKIITSSLTCLYLIKSWFKKIDNKYATLLSILYAFSSYSLALYIIPTWLDTVYLLPIYLVCLRKLLDENRKIGYIIVLTLSFIFDFYLTVMMLIFTVLASLIYLKIYKKDNLKQGIMNLGLSTLCSVLISSFVLLPTFLEIKESARIGFDLQKIFTSKLGPISDKALFFVSSFLPCSTFIILLLKYKEHKKFLNLLFPLVVMLLLPVLIEPINKMWHLGSYIFYPYRYGFITILLLIICSAYFFNKEENIDDKNYLSLGISITSSILIGTLIIKFFPSLQECVDKLTFTISFKTLLVMVSIFAIGFISNFIIIYLIKNNKFRFISLAIISLTSTLFLGYMYIGIDFDQENLENAYHQMNYLSTKEFDNYRLKIMSTDYIHNFSMVSKYNTLDHFTSLTNNNTFNVMQYLGYNTNWMNTMSKGSNIFIDHLLSHKYMVSPNQINNKYYTLKDTYTDNGTMYLYESTLNPSFAYLIKENISINEGNNSFENTNLIYKSFGYNDNIFEIIKDFKLVNLEYKNGTLVIIDKEKEAFIEKELNINDERNLYFELINAYDNSTKQKIYNKFSIYINDELIIEKYPSVEYINSVDLGLFNNETLNIKVKITKDTNIKHMAIGLLDTKKLENFFNKNNNSTLTYNNNKLSINYNANEDGILFIPYNYLDELVATNNGNEVEIIKVYNNYIGIQVIQGENNIEISFIPKRLILGTILSIIGIIFTFIYLKFNKTFNKLTNIIYYSYLIVLGLFIILIYLVPFIMFFISFI